MQCHSLGPNDAITANNVPTGYGIVGNFWMFSWGILWDFTVASPLQKFKSNVFSNIHISMNSMVVLIKRNPKRTSVKNCHESAQT